MRWCSREVGVGGCWRCACCVCGAPGRPAGGAPTERIDELQPASARASTAAQANRAGRRPALTTRDSFPLAPTFSALSLIPLGDLDLFRPRCLDPRPGALLNPSPHPQPAVLELAQVKAGGGKNALIAFQ